MSFQTCMTFSWDTKNIYIYFKKYSLCFFCLDNQMLSSTQKYIINNCINKYKKQFFRISSFGFYIKTKVMFCQFLLLTICQRVEYLIICSIFLFRRPWWHAVSQRSRPHPIHHTGVNTVPQDTTSGPDTQRKTHRLPRNGASALHQSLQWRSKWDRPNLAWRKLCKCVR